MSTAREGTFRDENGPAESLQGGTNRDVAFPGSVYWLASLKPGRACVEWDAPGYDPSRERLRGYTIYRLQNRPDATVAQKVPIAKFLQGATLFCEPFQQTYRYSTGGDIEGYVIEPIYESLWGQTQGQVYPGESTTVRLPIG